MRDADHRHQSHHGEDQAEACGKARADFQIFHGKNRPSGQYLELRSGATFENRESGRRMKLPQRINSLAQQLIYCCNKEL
jgi:hypothetical protein